MEKWESIFVRSYFRIRDDYLLTCSVDCIRCMGYYYYFYYSLLFCLCVCWGLLTVGTVTYQDSSSSSQLVCKLVEVPCCRSTIIVTFHHGATVQPIRDSFTSYSTWPPQIINNLSLWLYWWILSWNRCCVLHWHRWVWCGTEIYSWCYGLQLC